MDKVEEYIEKQKPLQKKILKKLRKIILKNFPNIKEEWRWGVPVYGGKYYIAGMKERVHMGFSVKGMSEKELENFEGKGEYMRHIKIRSLDEIDEKKILKLMKMVK